MSRKSNGWVKIYSGILQENLTPSQFKFFVGAIILANPINSQKPGTVDMSVRRLSSTLNMSPTEVWRREKELSERGMITLDEDNRGFLINKYSVYQSRGVSPTKQSVSPAEQTTTDEIEQSVSPAEQSVSPAEQGVSPAEQSVSFSVPEQGYKKKKYKEVKEVKSNNSLGKSSNEKNIDIPDFIDKNTWKDFLEMRRKMKAPPTPKAVRLILKELVSLKKAGNPPNQVLEQSIMNNWKGVFALKGGKGGRGNQRQAGGPGGHHAAGSASQFSREYENPDDLFGEGYTDRQTQPSGPGNND